MGPVSTVGADVGIVAGPQKCALPLFQEMQTRCWEDKPELGAKLVEDVS